MFIFILLFGSDLVKHTNFISLNLCGYEHIQSCYFLLKYVWDRKVGYRVKTLSSVITVWVEGGQKVFSEVSVVLNIASLVCATRSLNCLSQLSDSTCWGVEIWKEAEKCNEKLCFSTVSNESSIWRDKESSERKNPVNHDTNLHASCW